MACHYSSTERTFKSVFNSLFDVYEIGASPLATQVYAFDRENILQNPNTMPNAPSLNLTMNEDLKISLLRGISSTLPD